MGRTTWHVAGRVERAQTSCSVVDGVVAAASSRAQNIGLTSISANPAKFDARLRRTGA
jgi:hypothetical protein